jgi:hypothetical protein
MRKQPKAALPPLSVELAILAMSWQASREMFGMAFCHDTGVGALRRRFGPLPGHKPTETGEMVRAEARTFLGEICAHCPFEDCPMKHWGMF